MIRLYRQPSPGPTYLQTLSLVAAAIVAALFVDTLVADAPNAEETGSKLSPQALQEMAQVEAEIDRIEAQTIEPRAAPPDNQIQQIELLGRLMLYDKNLSVYRNEACTFCHMPETGFTGPVSELNRTTAAYPGSLRTRFIYRKTQSPSYAPRSPVLHYNRGQGDLVGGNFWDMRATGRRLGNPAAEQAQGPPTNPVEMGLPDIACAVYRASQRPYRALFESVWGRQAFAIAWPRDVEQVCARAGPPPAGAPIPVHLGSLDRGRAGATFDQMAQSIAGYEASAEVTPFTSKFDAVLAGKAQFTTQEQAGYDLFRGKAKCNACHRDGGPGEDPLFTDFTASNIGTPANPRLSLLRGKSARRTRLCRQSGRVIVHRWRRRQFSHQGASAQPALRSRSAMGQAGARQPGANSGADTAQCGQAALSGLREGLYAQRIFHESEGDRALLQHARRPAALPVP